MNEVQYIFKKNRALYTKIKIKFFTLFVTAEHLYDVPHFIGKNNLIRILF